MALQLRIILVKYHNAYNISKNRNEKEYMLYQI